MCVREAAEDGGRVAEALHTVVAHDCRRILASEHATVAAVRLLDLLPSHPVVNVARVGELLELTPLPAFPRASLFSDTSEHWLNATGRQRGRR